MANNPMQNSLQQTLGDKRDQWSGKGSVTGGNLGRMEGYDAKNFNDPNMQTAKYQNGRIFSRYDPNDAGALDKIMSDAEFKSLFPNAKGVGPDKIDYGDGRPVDVIRGHGAPGAAWSWQTMDDAGGGVTSRVPGLSGGGSMPLPGEQSDLMAQIMAALQSEQEPVDPQVLLQQQLR